ncbi:MAG: ATP-binding protein [Thermodesulfovibrionales bacterium]
MMNLIVNALQAMPDGGIIKIDMTDSKSKNGDLIIVDITDTGIGIKKEFLEKIFDPFFSTKDRGTGLGLTIASNIMQSHGGFIKVRSEEGKGSTFSLHFPHHRDNF